MFKNLTRDILIIVFLAFSLGGVFTWAFFENKSPENIEKQKIQEEFISQCETKCKSMGFFRDPYYTDDCICDITKLIVDVEE